jgi:hypothetical protein
MILTGGKPCPSTTSSTANLTWTDLGSKTRLRSERPVTDRVSHLNPGVHENYLSRFDTCHPENTLLLLYKQQAVIMAAYCGSQTTFDRARERECCSGGLVTGAGRQTAWKRNLSHCDTAVGIGRVCVCVCVVS